MDDTKVPHPKLILTVDMPPDTIVPEGTDRLDMFPMKAHDPELDGIIMPGVFNEIWQLFNEKFPLDPHTFRTIPRWCWDIEAGFIGTMRWGDPESRTYKQWVKDACQFVDLARGAGCKSIGMYNIPPGKTPQPGNNMVRVPDELMKRLDCCMPVTYFYEYHEPEGYIRYVEHTVAYAKEYGIPVFPFVGPRYASGTPWTPKRTKLLPPSLWAELLQGFAEVGADGVALWDSTYLLYKHCVKNGKWYLFYDRWEDEMEPGETPYQYTLRVCQYMADMCGAAFNKQSDPRWVKKPNQGPQHGTGHAKGGGG